MYHGWILTPSRMTGVLPRTDFQGWARARIREGAYVVSDMMALTRGTVNDAEAELARRVPTYAVGILDTGALYFAVPGQPRLEWIGHMGSILFPHLDLSAPDHTLDRTGVVSLAAERLLRALHPRGPWVLDDRALLRLTVEGLDTAHHLGTSLAAVFRGVQVRQDPDWLPLAA